MGVPVFEGLRRRTEPEIPPWPEQTPAAAPEPADPLDGAVYHVPRRSDPASGGTGSPAPPWARPDLDPQRLDGRSSEATPPSRHLAEREPADVPSSEDPRRSLLHRGPDPAAVDTSGMDVEARPRRTFPVRWPGASHETRVRPEYHGVGVLRTATPAHRRVRTRGLGLMFPPHTVHGRDSTSVVAGTCELTRVDHVHIRQAVVAPGDALRSGRVREIVARAVPGQDHVLVVQDLRRALNDPAGPAALRADCVPSLHRAETVRLGDDAMTRLDSRYVVERTTVPAGALLAGSEDLARRYVAVVADASDDPEALAEFLGDLVGAAANATDDNVLGYADGLPDQRSTVLGLFGMVTVDHATSVMIGVGDQPHTELDLGATRPRG
jgi:hypothetical protein